MLPLSSFPTRESFRILGRAGARYVVFHLDMYDARSRERLLERIDTYRAVPAPAGAGRRRVALRNRRLAELALFVLAAVLHTWPLAAGAGMVDAPGQRRHRAQHLGRWRGWA